MTFADPDFPSSKAFDAIAEALKADDVRKQALTTKGVFAFTLKNKAGKEKSWHIDLKESGAVAEGLGKKPTTTLVLADETFADLASGKAQAQKLFMTGKLKLKGDMMKATKLEPLLKKAQGQAKL